MAVAVEAKAIVGVRVALAIADGVVVDVPVLVAVWVRCIVDVAVGWLGVALGWRVRPGSTVTTGGSVAGVVAVGVKVGSIIGVAQ